MAVVNLQIIVVRVKLGNLSETIINTEVQSNAGLSFFTIIASLRDFKAL
jgi:dethiobiotin synthetase